MENKSKGENIERDSEDFESESEEEQESEE